jgi:hypothetical protein
VSYDLAVWEGDRPANDLAARAEFQRLYDRYMGSDAPVEPTTRVAAYVEALLARYPDLTTDAGEDSPWSTGPLINEAKGPLLYFPMVWSRCEETSEWAARLAEEHGLNCYDLTRADDRYVQVGYGEQGGTRSGWYALERRDGAPDQHYRAELTNVEEVVRAFVGFLEDDPTIAVRFPWRPYTA